MPMPRVIPLNVCKLTTAAPDPCTKRLPPAMTRAEVWEIKFEEPVATVFPRVSCKIPPPTVVVPE